MARALSSTHQGRKRLRISPGYLFVAPAVILITLLAIYPTYRVANLSVVETDKRTDETRPVGFANYELILNDPFFQKAFKQTIYFSGFSSLGHIVLGFGLALFMNSKLNQRVVNTCRAVILSWWLSLVNSGLIH
jgi:multiple sugar transport system permease protein